MVSLPRYRQLVFDCDGVLVDSNALKEANIREAACSLCDAETAERFVSYFVGNNGLPRETKIETFFDDNRVRQAILASYNHLNASSIPFLELAPGAKAFLDRIVAENMALYVLSGGDQHEVRALLENAGVAFLFREILGGPTSKAEHLQRLGLRGSTCYFGDSRYDYEVAREFGFDFVFLSRYSQFRGWREFFASKARVTVAYDFRSFHWNGREK